MTAVLSEAALNMKNFCHHCFTEQIIENILRFPNESAVNFCVWVASLLVRSHKKMFEFKKMAREQLSEERAKKRRAFW